MPTSFSNMHSIVNVKNQWDFAHIDSRETDSKDMFIDQWNYEKQSGKYKKLCRKGTGNVSRN